MNTTTHLFDRYKETLGVRSDRQAAMKLGVKVQTVSNWRTRGSQAEAATIDAMCNQLREDPMPWLLRIQAEQGGDDSRNGRVWQRVATQLGVSLSMAVVALEGLAALITGGLDLAAGSSFGALTLATPVNHLLPLFGL
ncbi:MAG TPA: hypothetical protein VFJ01_02080 [Oleiagrimonas sp.]|nr:hypothetical protein [Oleiagrimonas sp.]